MIDFLKVNYELIILIVACLLDLVLFLVGVCKKKKEPVMSSIYSALPDFIKTAELSGLKGKDKLVFVLDLAGKLYEKLVGSDDLPCGFLAEVQNAVEKILETPQKKG